MSRGEPTTTFSILQKDYPRMRYDEKTNELVLYDDATDGRVLICHHPMNAMVLIDKDSHWIISWHLRDRPYLYVYDCIDMTDDIRGVLHVLNKRWANASMS